METLQAHELFAGLLLVLASILFLKQLVLAPSKRGATSPSLPCPRGLPLIGNLHQLGVLPQDSLAALAAKHAAPVMLLRLGSVPTLVVSTADALRAVFQPNDRAMSGRPALYAATRITYDLQDIVFSHPEGAFWRAARRASLSELLGAPRVRCFRGVREGEAAALVAVIADVYGTGAPVDLSNMLMATSNKIVRRIAFGGDDGKESVKAGAVLEETQRLLGGFFVADYMPWLGWLDALTGMRRRLERNFHELDAIYERVIDQHLNKPSVSMEEEDLVDVLLHLHTDPAHRSTFDNRSKIKGHVHCRDRHVGGDGGMDDDGASQEPGRPRQGAARGARRGGRHGHSSRVRPPAAPVPEESHPGVDAAAPAGAAPGAPRDHRALHGVRLRDTGRDAGDREREGHRPGPRRVGPRHGAVRARAARGRGGSQRPQAVARQLLARAVRGRPEELPRRSLRDGRRRTASRQPAALLRLACAAGRGGRGGGGWVDGAQEEPSGACG